MSYWKRVQKLVRVQNSDSGKCQKSNCSNAGKSLHSCPYAVDIHDNRESLCNCCSDCTHQCAQDI